MTEAIFNRLENPDFKLDPAFKAKWLAELRSGKYPKGAGRLCTVDGEYCCLGVVAKMEDRLTEARTFEAPQGDGFAKSCGFLTSDGEENWHFIPRDIQKKLASINDTSRTWDPVIAFIEENL
jgi:hypothetical protein